MYFQSVKGWMHVVDGILTLAMPFKEDGDFAWPLFEPRRDSGKYIAGLFEGGDQSNGVKCHAVSTWTRPAKVVAATGTVAGRQTVFQAISPEEFQATLPEAIAEDIVQTCLLVGNYSYYGPSEEKNQSYHDKWLVAGTEKTGLEEMIRVNGPWQF